MKEQIRQIINQLNEATKAYDEGHPIMTDKAWDDLYFYLQQLERQSGIYLPDSPTQKINFEITTPLRKVEHTHLMLSLDKTKDLNEIKTFVKKHPSICMGKMDGLTCALRYKDGELIAAETRGNGVIGEDVFYNIIDISNLPKRIPIKDEVEVDGEIICKYDDFEPFAEEYKNPRNFAAGSIRLLDSKEYAKRNLSFVAWDWINNPYPRLGDALVELKGLGFTTVPYWDGIETDFDDLDIIVDFVKKSCANEKLPIDGLVFKYDYVTDYQAEGRTGHHFKGGLAFKFYDECVETEIEDIEWSMGREGRLTPVAIFKPIELEGTEVSRASLHNLSVLDELCGGQMPMRGDIVSVYKANQIIPQIDTWTTTIEPPDHFSVDQGLGDMLAPPEVCPICGGRTEIIEEDSGTKNLWCTNDACPGKLVNRLVHYCDMKKGMAIKGLSEKLISRFMDKGWLNSFFDLYNLHQFRTDMEKMEGLGPKSVDNILTAIEESKNCELWQFISALGIPLIGTTASKDLANHFSTWANFYKSIKENFIYSTLPNFGFEMNKALHDYDYSEAEKIAAILNFKEPKAEEIISEILQGKKICITGKLVQFKNRSLFQEAIEARGGKVVSGVTGATDFLVTNDTESGTAKNQAAKKLNIPIMSEEEFIKNFLT